MITPLNKTTSIAKDRRKRKGKFHVQISQEYWPIAYRNWHHMSDIEKEQAKQAEVNKIYAFLRSERRIAVTNEYVQIHKLL